MCEQCLAFHNGLEADCSCGCREPEYAGARRERQGVAFCRPCAHYVSRSGGPGAPPPIRIRDLSAESPPVSPPTGYIVPTVPIGTALRILSLHFEGLLDRDVAPLLGVSQSVVAAVIARAYRHYHVDRPGTGVSTAARQLWEGGPESARQETAQRVVALRG